MAKKKDIHMAVNVKLLAEVKEKGYKAATVNARLWWDKTYGNTYNSFELSFLINDRWQTFAIGSMVYGYGRYYMQRVSALLESLDIPYNVDLFCENETTGLKRDLYKANSAIFPNTDFVDVLELGVKPKFK